MGKEAAFLPQRWKKETIKLPIQNQYSAEEKHMDTENQTPNSSAMTEAKCKYPSATMDKEITTPSDVKPKVIRNDEKRKGKYLRNGGRADGYTSDLNVQNTSDGKEKLKQIVKHR